MTVSPPLQPRIAVDRREPPCPWPTYLARGPKFAKTDAGDPAASGARYQDIYKPGGAGPAVGSRRCYRRVSPGGREGVQVPTTTTNRTGPTGH